MKILWIVFVAFVLLTSMVPERSGNSHVLGPETIRSAHIDATCVTERELLDELDKLSVAETQTERANIVDLLIGEARKSLQCRKKVITVLARTMDKPDLDLERDRPAFNLWHYGSEILAELKATEALDVLIAHLDLHDGTVFPLNHHPAMVAVVRMGRIAMPRLAAALRESDNPYLRRHIAFCIGWLGGTNAQRILRKALSIETDACTGTFIRRTLAALNNKTQPNQITSSDRLKWYASFRCDTQ